MAIKQDVNAPLILTVGIVSAVLLLVVVFGVQAWFIWEENGELAEKWRTAQNTQLISLRSEQRANIQRDGKVTVRLDEKNTATVPMTPIGNAMTLVIQNGGKLPATQPAKANK